MKLLEERRIPITKTKYKFYFNNVEIFILKKTFFYLRVVERYIHDIKLKLSNLMIPFPILKDFAQKVIFQ